MDHIELPKDLIEFLHKGVVIPALPLKLDLHRKLDEGRQRALMRHYLDAGVGLMCVKR